MTETNNKSFKLIGLISSVILHLCMFSNLSNNIFKTSKKLNLKPSLNLELVSRFESPIQELRERIVPESDIRESKVAPKTNNIASKNTVVKKEQVKKGFGKAKKNLQKNKQRSKAQVKKRIKQKAKPIVKKTTRARNLNPNLNPNLNSKPESTPSSNLNPGFNSNLSPTLKAKQQPIREQTAKNDPLAGFSKFRSGVENKAVKKNNLNSYQPFKYLTWKLYILTWSF